MCAEMDASSVEVLMLTDPFFWEKAEYITKQAFNGTLYLRERLPFDAVTLVYYLLFCPTVDRIFSPSGNPRVTELREILSNNEEVFRALRSARLLLTTPPDNIAVTSISDSTATTRSYVNDVDIPQNIRFDDVKAANEAGQLHEVFRLLSERAGMIAIGAYKFISFLKYASPSIRLHFGVPGITATVVCNWSVSTGAWVVMGLEAPILLESTEGSDELPS